MPRTWYQDTFVKCYESMHQLHDPTRVKAWLFRILTRTAWRACQKHRRELPVENLYDSQEPVGEDASAPLLRADRARAVARALMSLNLSSAPPPYSTTTTTCQYARSRRQWAVSKVRSSPVSITHVNT